MVPDDESVDIERFLRCMFVGNVGFTILITAASVFLFILGISSTTLLSALLFMSMLYLLFMAYWGNEIATNLRKHRKRR
ncbi:MAG: hypothetical protein R6V01_04085 [Thermoplasmatota archaeon]